MILQPPRISGPISPDSLGLSAEHLRIQTDDHVELDGYWVKTKKDTVRGLIILVHGIGGCKEHWLGLSKELAEGGIETIVFDGRAHGKSGGEFCTYGYKEKYDIMKIIDRVQAANPALRIGIWGNSLGGAIAIQALATDNRISFGVIESTFAELDKIVDDYLTRSLHGVRLRFVSDYGLKRAGQLADFNPDEVKPIESVKKISQPMFIAHGDADTNISVEYGKQLFEQLRSTDKELVIVAGAGHFDLAAKGGEAYKRSLFKFIERNVE
jgi:hypothetical protein